MPARVVGEGVKLGIVAATATWVWLAVIDAAAGRPFHSFTVLGGIAAFTVVHYLLNIAYGVTIVSAVRAAAREPSLAIAVVFGLVTLEIAFAMFTILLSHVGLGRLAWAGVFGGSVLSVVIVLFMLSRRHLFLARVRDADSDTSEQLHSQRSPSPAHGR
jgi:hypothetical protein